MLDDLTDVAGEIESHMVGRNLCHPLMFVDQVSTYPQYRLKKLLQQLIVERNQFFESGNIVAYVRLHEPAFRWQALLEWQKPFSRDELFFSFLGELWRNNGIFDVSPTVLTDFFCDASEMQYMMNELDRQFLDLVPDGTTIYRGADEYLRQGCSWTLKKNVASAYALHYGSKACVWKTVFQKSFLPLYFDRTGEQEVLIPAKFASHLHVEIASA